MAKVETVLGPVETPALGSTLMHEHVFVLTSEIQEQYPGGWDEEERIRDAVAKLSAAKERGIDTIVDLTVYNMGRSVERLKRVSAESGVRIVVATGYYTYNDLHPYFGLVAPAVGESGLDKLTDVFVHEISVGIGVSGIKAAILKCATDAPGVTPGVERVLRACAQAHRQTGAPISTHTNAQLRRGLEQQRVFLEEGVDLRRVVIGHSGDTTDTDYLEELIDNGSCIGMDRFGLDPFLPYADRVDTLVKMCKKGHANKMVLSHDHACHVDWDSPFPPRDSRDRAALMEQFAPRWKLTHISEDVVPALRERGVDDGDIDLMLVQNPRRIFEEVAPY